MVFIFGLPQTFQWLGVTWQTALVLMAVLLTVTVFITLGGMTTLMITDCIEGMITQVFYLIIIAALLFMFDWGQIIETLSGNLPGQSKLNPFDSAANEDFNVYFVLMGILLGETRRWPDLWITPRKRLARPPNRTSCADGGRPPTCRSTSTRRGPSPSRSSAASSSGCP
jgi:hypothetical protein